MYQVVANILRGNCFGNSCLHDRLTLLATLDLLIAELYRLKIGLHWIFRHFVHNYTHKRYTYKENRQFNLI